jgi:hypothetical protein
MFGASSYVGMSTVRLRSSKRGRDAGTGELSPNDVRGGKRGAPGSRGRHWDSELSHEEHVPADDRHFPKAETHIERAAGGVVSTGIEPVDVATVSPYEGVHGFDQPPPYASSAR